MTTVCDLAKGRCKPCEGGVPPLADDEVAKLLATLDGWKRDGNVISKNYQFKNYYETMAFVNGWGRCTVSYTTHAIGGLSENDFICAAKIDALFAL